jgi:hypothetical protein
MYSEYSDDLQCPEVAQAGQSEFKSAQAVLAGAAVLADGVLVVAPERDKAAPPLHVLLHSPLLHELPLGHWLHFAPRV